MKMTEDEAKGKWCPFAAETDAKGGSYNRVMGKNDQLTSCMGRDCMAWRWEDSLYYEGHCGLVGKP